MAMDFDSQLIESVEVRRNRLSASFLFGLNPTERRWNDRARSFVYGLIIAAVICAFCVALSFVINILTNYINDRNEREQEREEMEREREQMELERERQERLQQQEEAQSLGPAGSLRHPGPVVDPAATAILGTLDAHPVTTAQPTLWRS